MNKQKVRARQTYQDFTTLAVNLLKAKKLSKQLLVIYKYLDSKSFFGSISASEYAKESMDLVVEDIKILEWAGVPESEAI